MTIKLVIGHDFLVQPDEQAMLEIMSSNFEGQPIREKIVSVSGDT